MTTRSMRRPIHLDTSLPESSVALEDGSIWSHAAVLGTFIKGTAFTIDRAAVENFVRVFTAGYPRKVPVDYDHASTNGAAGNGHPVIKAGDVLEMAGVFGADDFAGNADLKRTAEQLATSAGRTLDDARNFGLWIRWKPTRRALGMIKEREYTELSITFFEDYPHNETGEGQGPTIIAVALTNLPFLDDMLPVAASRRTAPGGAQATGGSPAAPGNKEDDTMSQQTSRIMLALAALLGKPVATEDEGATELSQLQERLKKQEGEMATLRSFRAMVGAELGSEDPGQAVVKIKELKGAADAAKTQGQQAAAAAIDAQVEATLKEYEAHLTVPTKTYFGAQLRAELEKGVKAADSETVKVLKQLSGAAPSVTGRQSAPDSGANAPTGEDARVQARAEELMKSDPEISEVAKSDRYRALRMAISKAGREVRTS